jgi:hypothetical protein
MGFDILDLYDRNNAYDIKPKPGGDLPFDFRGEGNLDLVVSKVNKNAYDLLGDFDLTICKASWNGKNFRIPNPHQAFAGKSTYNPLRRAVLNSYMKHFNPPDVTGERNESRIVMASSKSAAATVQKVRRDVPHAPFYDYMDRTRFLRDEYDPDADPLGWDSRGSFNDKMVQAKHGASIQFHNWTLKLIGRLEKYQGRGIDVIDAPRVRDDIEYFKISPHEV